MKHGAQESIDNLYDEAAIEYDVDEDTGELQMRDCTNSNKYIAMREPIQKLVDCQFVPEELDWIRLKIMGCDSTNKYCLLWDDEKIETIEMHIEAKIIMQENLWEEM